MPDVPPHDPRGAGPTGPWPPQPPAAGDPFAPPPGPYAGQPGQPGQQPAPQWQQAPGNHGQNPYLQNPNPNPQNPYSQNPNPQNPYAQNPAGPPNQYPPPNQFPPPNQPNQLGPQNQYGPQNQFGPQGPSSPQGQFNPYAAQNQAPAPRTPMSPRTRNILLAVLAAATVAVLAVSGTIIWAVNRGVRTAAGDKLGNAEAFLASSSSSWRAALPPSGVSVKDDSSCYYVLDEADRSTGSLGCGPVLRPEGSADKAWDLYTFDVAGDQATNLKAESQGQPLPERAHLADAKGSTQDVTAQGLEVPDFARVEPGTVLQAGAFSLPDGAAGQAVDLGPDARLVGLGTVVTVAGLQEVERATVTSTGVVSRAAEGEKLYLLTLGGEVPAPNSLSGDNGLKISLDGKEADVPLLHGTELLFSSAPGGDALVLDSAGQKQSLDLLSGVRAGNPRTEPLYTTNYPVGIDRNVTIQFSQTRGSDGVIFDLTSKLKRTEVTPFRDGEWAPDGQVFVEAAIENNAVATSPGGRSYVVECPGSTVDGGSVQTCGSGLISDVLVSMTAPATGSATLHYAPTLKVSGGTKPQMDVTFSARPITVPYG